MSAVRWTLAVTYVLLAGLNTYAALTDSPLYWIPAVLFLACAAIWARMAVEFKPQPVRTISTTIEVHQHPGESAEVFARRLADELSRDAGWMR